MPWRELLCSDRMRDYDLDTLTDTYLRHQATKRDEDFWAFEEVDTIVRDGDLDRVWELTLLLLKKAMTDEALGYVAAGPLEDMIRRYGDQALDRVEQACEGDSRIQLALSGVWLPSHSRVLQRWQDFMTKYGFRSGNRQPL